MAGREAALPVLEEVMGVGGSSTGFQRRLVVAPGTTQNHHLWAVWGCLYSTMGSYTSVGQLVDE